MDELFRYTSGPHAAKVLIVGEAWGASEHGARQPFVGMAGTELTRMLTEAGIRREECLLTNVVHAQPPGNEFTHFLFPTSDKKLSLGLYKDLYPRPVLLDGVKNLQLLIETVKPKLIIGCGNIPLWALTSHATVSSSAGYKVPGGIMNWRGSQTFYHTPTGAIPYLPIIHPAAILRSWDLRSITIHDLRRAANYLSGKLTWTAPGFSYDHFPSYDRVMCVLDALLQEVEKAPLEIVVDIETYRRQHIVCIGLATSTHTICTPFFWFDELGQLVEHFTPEQETTVCGSHKRLLEHPNARVIGQNLIYDYQFILRRLGIKLRMHADTMCMHHLCFPGTPKSLEYLASLYCQHYLYWKDESQDWAGKGDPNDLFLYNCKDTKATLEIYHTLTSVIEKMNKGEQWEFQKEQWHLAADMMLRGVRYNKPIADKMRLELQQAAHELETWLLAAMPDDLQYAAGGSPWYDSPKLTQQIFYTYLGFPPILHKKTKQPTANYEALVSLAKRHPWIAPITSRLEQLRSIQVFLSHFFDIKLSPDTRLRTNFNISGTETFRWSSSSTAFDEGTNLQNIPKGD